MCVLKYAKIDSPSSLISIVTLSKDEEEVNRKAQKKEGRSSVLEGVPKSLPPL
jgi:hypothetical protein